MASQLDLYNQALRNLGERRLASLSEEREPRRLLDDVWSGGTAIRYCLEQGQWVFALRTRQLDYSPTVTPPFGLRYAFDKDSDWVRTAGIFSDERCNVPLTAYREEAGFIFADLSPIWVTYVSDDASYGGDLSLWPETFSQYVGAFLASEIAEKLTSSAQKADRVEKMAHALLVDARSKDAMQGGTQFKPVGSWVQARSGRGGTWLDRGNRNSLIG